MNKQQKEQRTNDECIQALLSDLHMVQIALLRERIVKIAEITREDIKEHPEDWKNPIVPVRMFVDLCDKIDLYLGFED